MTKRLVPATLIPSFLDLAIKNRMNVEKIFAQADIDPAIIGDNGAYLTYEQIIRLLDAAVEETRDAAFGVHLGESIQYHSLDLVGQVIATSRNLEAALYELLEFKDLVAPFTQFSVEKESEVTVLAFAMDPSVIKRYLIVHHDVVAATIVSLAKALTGGKMRIQEVRFAHSEPAYIAEYQRVFDAPVRFGYQRNEIRIPSADLQMPLLTSFPEYHSRMQRLAREKLRTLEERQSLGSRVITYIEKNLGLHPTLLDDVASHFSMTPRTLQRKLKLENSSFAELRDQCRHTRALRELADPETDIDALALLLGFSDTSNFYHAFKRWEGQSPGAYRKQVLRLKGY